MSPKILKFTVLAVAVIISIAAMVSTATKAQGTQQRDDRMKVKAGDDLNWKHPDFDDGDWLGYRAWQIKTGAYRGNLWVRQTLALEPNSDREVFVLAATGSSEIYFNGELIGRNGVVGDDAAEEEPGSLLFHCTIPKHLRQADNQIAIRFSNHRGVGRFYLLGGGVGSLPDVLAFTRISMFPFLFLAVFIVIAIYFAVLWILNRDRPSYAVFAAICALTACLLFAESLRALGYPYHWHGYRLRLIATLSAGLAALLPLLFILRHDLARYWLLGIPLGMAVAAARFHRHPDEFAFGQFIAALLFAQLAVCVAYHRGKTNALLGVIAVSQALLILCLTGMSFMEQGLFVSITILIVIILISLGLQIRRERVLYQETRLRSARLQIELLKKHLQPHFMLNTLTAVMEWLEREPKTGVAFIASLAEEMKMLNRMADQTLVSLEDECLLCRRHLDLLTYRTGECYAFETDYQNPDLQIPPALLLTLVENGISYALDEGTVRFELHQRLTETRTIEMIFRAVGVTINTEANDDGTGGKYIKARLEESFPGRWQLEASGQDQTWTTHITLKGAP
ncbi:histidine kinase [Acanthopleuribacter pedis]|uniref:Histidine kinase n=1 Tax=Acanthopleuribacter pedis TaxID=442870 RepID=A0A8J7Q9L2_9BACT|nr:sensor histidine kinase [Acanthopleuribacter pedis]MBO1319489.1 histidine kinase [Acanthopleuribacter pedis]